MNRNSSFGTTCRVFSQIFFLHLCRLLSHVLIFPFSNGHLGVVLIVVSCGLIRMLHCPYSSQSSPGPETQLWWNGCCITITGWPFLSATWYYTNFPLIIDLFFSINILLIITVDAAPGRRNSLYPPQKQHWPAPPAMKHQEMDVPRGWTHWHLMKPL